MTGQENVASSCAREGSGWTSGRNFSPNRWLSLGTDCAGKCGVSTPGSNQEMTGHVFSNLNNSMKVTWEAPLPAASVPLDGIPLGPVEL